MKRLVLVATALTIPLAVTTVGLVGFAGTAGASARPACSTVSGNTNTKVFARGCGGGLGVGQIKQTSSSTGTITWRGLTVVKGKPVVKFQGTTTVDNIVVTLPPTSRCATGSTENDITGTVSADTTHRITVGSTLSADVCISPTGAVHLVKGTVAKL